VPSQPGRDLVGDEYDAKMLAVILAASSGALSCNRPRRLLAMAPGFPVREILMGRDARDARSQRANRVRLTSQPSSIDADACGFASRAINPHVQSMRCARGVSV
jgi:hypothetical protein